MCECKPLCDHVRDLDCLLEYLGFIRHVAYYLGNRKDVGSAEICSIFQSIGGDDDMPS